MVRLAGIEPTTPWFVAKYSIQLSYSRCEEARLCPKQYCCAREYQFFLQKTSTKHLQTVLGHQFTEFRLLAVQFSIAVT